MTPDVDVEMPIMVCPRCGHEEEDFDGLGVVFCPQCRYCQHIARSGDGKGNMVCDFCGDAEVAP